MTSTGGTATRTGTQGTPVYSSGSTATGDLLLLGTWTGASWNVGGVGSTDSHFSYAAGTPTTLLGASAGQRASYTLLSATPVYTSQNIAGSVASASLTVDFLSASSSLGNLALSLNLPRASGGSGLYSLAGTLAGNGSSLGGALSIGGADCSSGADLCQPGSAQGFFVGLLGGKVAISYQGATANVGGFGGALALGQSGGRGFTPTITASSATTYVASFAYYGAAGTPTQQTVTSDGDRVGFYGSELTQIRPRGTQPDFQKTSGITPVTASSANAGGIGTPGSADFIGWGSWDSGTVNASGANGITNAHYIVATPTPDLSMPTSGTASYTVIDGSAPVSSRLGAGTLNSGSLSVNFNAATVAAQLNLGFGGSNYTVNGNGQFRQAGQAAAVIVPVAGATGIQAVINGVFSGPNAYRAGLAYGVINNTTLGNVNGAAVFQKAP